MIQQINQRRRQPQNRATRVKQRGELSPQPEFLSSRQHSADRTVVPHASIRSSTRSRVRDSSRPRHRLGADGGRMSATGNGARFGRITARAAPRGTICRMITLVAARIGGARMRSADTATRGSAGVWAWRYARMTARRARDCGSLVVSTTDNRACYTKPQSVGSSAGSQPQRRRGR
jgi:hypothetical protein